MSVVNRMLLDIDRRLGEPGVEAHRPHDDIRIAESPFAPPPPSLGVKRASAYLVVGALLVVLAWFATHGEAIAPTTVAVSTPAAKASTGHAVAVGMVTPPQALAPTPTAVTTSEATAPIEQTPAEEKPPEPKAAEEKPADGPGAPSLRLSEWLAQTPTLAPKVAPAAPVVTAARMPAAAPVTRRTEVPVRQVAADETLAAARTLWNEGSRSAAIGTLRDGLSAAESTRNVAAVVELSRELARLEMASNQSAAALELLKRLEPTLATDADAWALRANAEQRLGQHRDAAASYLSALRLRPEEARWMLGAAISLAAEGRTDEARAWVARAKGLGPIPPAVSSYLQQLGLLPG